MAQANYGRLQDSVKCMMKTLLEDHPTLLSEGDRRNLMDLAYCQGMGLKPGFPLLRRKEYGREINGHARYWVREYANRYYVTKEWWPQHRVHNTYSLLLFAEEVTINHPGDAGIPALEKCLSPLRDYLINRLQLSRLQHP